MLRQNVANFSTQKHCIEVSKSAVELLNPGQVIIDTSDQPVYALSRQLQKLYPDSFGPGKYLPMFGGLHIEKLLLEIHGQLIAGSGLSKFLDQSNLSITGAGNVFDTVPQITSARYLLQVCLCAEFKAMKLVFDNSESALNLQQWIGEKETESAMFHHWTKIFELQILIMLFLRSEREKFSFIRSCAEVGNEVHFRVQSL